MIWKKLKSYGLNKYESCAYITLLKIGESTAAKISSESSVPHGKIYPTLESLKKKNFIKITQKNPKRFISIKPEIVLGKKLQEKKEKIISLEKETSNLFKVLSSLSSKKTIPTEKIQIINGFKNYLTTSTMLHNKTKKTWRSISRMPISKSHMDSYENSISRGVKIKILASLKRENRDYSIWIDMGVNIKNIGYIPTTFSVVDNTDVLIRICEDITSENFLAIWIHDSSFAKTMSEYFKTLWKTGKKIK